MDFETILKELIEKGKKDGFIKNAEITKYFTEDKDEYDKIVAELEASEIEIKNDDDDLNVYSKSVVDALKDAGVRVEFDDRSEKFGYKMREAQIAKVPYIVVLGKNEEEAKQISYRLHGEQGTTTVGFDEFVTLVTNEISSKKL